eukprot:12404017-Karenia_brevis.AAC.1
MVGTPPHRGQQKNETISSRRQLERAIQSERGVSIVQKLGEGGFGRAYKIQDKSGAARALKVMQCWP